jgi:hypothetical protein
METKMSIKAKIVAISNGLRLTKEGENPFQKFSYFKPDDILKALTPLLAEFRLFMSFNLPYSHEKNMYEAVLYFEDLEDEKQNITYKFDIPLTKVAGASEAQGAGATMTYAKRYSIMNAFSIADNSDDLDAKKPIVDYSPTNNLSDYNKSIVGANRAIKSDKNNELCPKCGGLLKNREGIKNGKHWQGQFCQNSECKHVIWGPKIQDIENQENKLNGMMDLIKEENDNDPRNYGE